MSPTTVRLALVATVAVWLRAATLAAGQIVTAEQIRVPVSARSGNPQTGTPDDWRTVRPTPPAAVQPPPQNFSGPNGQPTVAINAERIAVNEVDPLTYHAVALRLPPGMRPRVDGRMNDEVWSLAPAFGNFVQTEPDVGAPATGPTEFRILYDDYALYFGFWMWDDEPSGIRASELKRDALLRKGDQIKFVLGPFGDRRSSFYFSTNPLGAYKDGTGEENGRVQNFDWNANWLVRASRDEHGWYAEFEVPFSQIRYRQALGDSPWDFQACRVIIRLNENACWTPYPRQYGQPGVWRMSSAGLLHGLTDIKSPRHLEITPYVAPSAVRNYAAGTPADVSTSYGVDLRAGVTPTLTADLTYKTDFAQVEADEEVVNISRFSLFFPEKRQFFTESAALFNFGQGAGLLGDDAQLLQVFYSRRIGLDAQGRAIPIVAGGRITGRIGGYKVGVLNIQTERTTFPGATGTTTVPTANYSVVRVKRGIFGQSTLGGIFLNRQDGNGTGSYNRTAAGDIGILVGRNLGIAGALAKTFSNSSSGKNVAGTLDIDYENDRLYGSFTYLDIGERFDAQMGFVPRNDIRRPRLLAGWTPWPRRWTIKKLDLNGGVDYFENHRGIRQSRTDRMALVVTRDDNASLTASATRNFDVLAAPFRFGPLTVETGDYEWSSGSIHYQTDQSRRIYGGGTVNSGGYYNGDLTSYGGNIGLLPLQVLLIELNYTRNRFALPQSPAYTTNTVNARVSHSFTPNLFVKSFIQYNDARHSSNINLLLWYRYAVGSDLHLVYNQGWTTGLSGPRSYEIRDRSLQAKLTYWFAR